MKNLRAVAAHVVYQVMHDGRSLSDCLPSALQKFPEPRDQALLQAICYGVCRRFFYLDAVIYLLLEKPLEEKDEDIFALLLVGLYQLIDMRIPDYAAVAETVDAVQELDKVWAKGLVNAILRNFQRREEDVNEELQDDVVAFYAHPEWYIGMMQKAWPSQWEQILIANNEHPPLILRVNEQHITREKYLEKLAEQEIEAESVSETKCGIILASPLDVKLLPGFANGDVSVQDGAAQLAAELLDLQPGQRVLDACAAPGGKTAHIAETQSALLSLVAVDNDEDRLDVVKENLDRLKLSATCVLGDAGDVSTWWNGEEFDRILLDAPCSASGVIRRHPDIKLLRRPEDVQNLVKEQQRLLAALWPTLKVGGILLYATCSIFPRENNGVVSQFLAEHPDAKEEKIESTWGQSCDVGVQILPGMQYGMDGFYYARLRKCAAQ